MPTPTKHEYMLALCGDEHDSLQDCLNKASDRGWQLDTMVRRSNDTWWVVLKKPTTKPVTHPPNCECVDCWQQMEAGFA